jgi:hypothetical protein
MRLCDCTPGSIVALSPRDFVLVGSHLGPRGTKKRPGRPVMTLVHVVDPESVIPRLDIRGLRAVSPELEVEAVVATGEYLRAMCRRPFHLGAPRGESGNWTDPLVKGQVESDADEELAF